MKKSLIVLFVLIFILLTIFIASIDTSTNTRVSFSNQTFEINNMQGDIVNQTSMALNSSAKITNNDTSFNNFNSKFENSKIKSNDISAKNVGTITSTNSSATNITPAVVNQVPLKPASNASNFYNQNVGNSHNPSNTYNDFLRKNFNYDIYDRSFRRKFYSQYATDVVDWTAWKSNFVNAILSESMYIKSLDNYPKNSWLYYSFVTHKSGRISNVCVFSPSLSEADKKNMRELIISFENSDLTVFPENSKKKRQKLSNIMILTNETQYTTKEDFARFYGNSEHIIKTK